MKLTFAIASGQIWGGEEGLTFQPRRPGGELQPGESPVFARGGGVQRQAQTTQLEIKLSLSHTHSLSHTQTHTLSLTHTDTHTHTLSRTHTPPGTGQGELAADFSLPDHLCSRSVIRHWLLRNPHGFGVLVFWGFRGWGLGLRVYEDFGHG